MRTVYRMRRLRLTRSLENSACYDKNLANTSKCYVLTDYTRQRPRYVLIDPSCTHVYS